MSYSIHYSYLISTISHPNHLPAATQQNSVILASNLEGPGLLLLLLLLAQAEAVLMSQRRTFTLPMLHERSWTASCHASAEEGELHLVGIVSHDLSGVARRQGDARPAGTVQLQAQGICQRQILLNLHLLRLYTIKSQQAILVLVGVQGDIKNQGQE